MKKLLFTVLMAVSTICLSAQVNGVATFKVSSTSAHPIYFYIESAFNGSALGWTADLRGRITQAPTGDGRVMHYPIASITDKERALWSIENDLLKNKGTGKYLTQSHTAATTGSTLIVEGIVNAGKQYAFRTDNQTSYGIAWKNDRMDRLSSDFKVKDGAAAWYFILPNDNLQLAITNATNLLSTTTEGTGDGQYSTTVRNNLSAAIQTAQTNLDDGNSANDEAGANTLNNAFVTYLSTTELLSRINDANAFKADLAVGERFGEFAQTAIDNYKSTIVAAQGVYDNPASTPSDFDTQITNLGSAKSTIIGAINKNTSLLVSSNTGKFSWYKIKSNATAFPTVYGQVISSGAETEGQSFITEAYTAGNVRQLFRFEVGSNTSQVEAIVTKSGKYLKLNGTISDTNPNNPFEILPIGDGKSFHINNPAKAIGDWGAIIVHSDIKQLRTGNGGVGSVAAWTFEFVEETVDPGTGIDHTPTTPTYEIVVSNGTITVKGVENFELYSLSGQKIDTQQRLNTGMYLVRIADVVQKVIVK